MHECSKCGEDYHGKRDAISCAKILLHAQNYGYTPTIKYMRRQYPSLEFDETVVNCLIASDDNLNSCLVALQVFESLLACNDLNSDEKTALHRKCGEICLNINLLERAILHLENAQDYVVAAGVKQTLKKIQELALTLAKKGFLFSFIGLIWINITNIFVEN
jgi:hypothetical protein